MPIDGFKKRGYRCLGSLPRWAVFWKTLCGFWKSIYNCPCRRPMVMSIGDAQDMQMCIAYSPTRLTEAPTRTGERNIQRDMKRGSRDRRAGAKLATNGWP